MKILFKICVGEIVVRGVYVWYFVFTNNFEWPEPSVWGVINSCTLFVAILPWCLQPNEVDEEKDIIDHLID